MATDQLNGSCRRKIVKGGQSRHCSKCCCFCLLWYWSFRQRAGLFYSITVPSAVSSWETQKLWHRARSVKWEIRRLCEAMQKVSKLQPKWPSLCSQRSWKLSLQCQAASEDSCWRGCFSVFFVFIILFFSESWQCWEDRAVNYTGLRELRREAEIPTKQTLLVKQQWRLW